MFLVELMMRLDLPAIKKSNFKRIGDEFAPRNNVYYDPEEMRQFYKQYEAMKSKVGK